MEHQTTKEEKSLFNCDKCDKKFDNLESLKIHKESHVNSSAPSANELEEMKKDILEKVNAGKRRLYWGSAIVTGILIVLSLVSIAQAVQSATVLEKVKSGAVKPSGGTGNTTLPSSLENLPNMVGGC